MKGDGNLTLMMDDACEKKETEQERKKDWKPHMESTNRKEEKHETKNK